MAAITLRSIKGSPLTMEEVDVNFTNLNIEIGQKLDATSYNASDVLAKLKTVDSNDSGINASTLKGLEPVSTNTVSTVVSRDASGNFSANIITANLVGNASTVTDGVVTTGSYNDPAWITHLDYFKLTNTPPLTMVAITGSYNDLSDSPFVNSGSNIYKSSGSVSIGTNVAPPVTGSLRVAGNVYTGSTGYNGNIYAESLYLSDYQLAVETGDLFVSGVALIKTNTNTRNASLGVGVNASGTAGEIRATNNITAYYSSDAKLKENVKDVENALETVCAIGSKTFDWTDDYIESRGGEDGYFVQKSDFGVIAQDVQAVFPQAVRTREDGTLAVDYEKLATLSFGAIKELAERVKQLELK